MKAVRDVVESILTSDPILLALVGVDQFGYHKVYEAVARKDSQPPTVVWTIVPGLEPAGHYGDLRAFEGVEMQVTAWGRDPREAWNLFAEIEHALERGGWDGAMPPYNLMQIVRTGDQRPMQDQDTGWFQIPTTYRISVAR